MFVSFYSFILLLDSVPPFSFPFSCSSQALARQRPQQASGGGKEVDGWWSICDEGGLQPQSLEQFDLQGRRKREKPWSCSECVSSKMNIRKVWNLQQKFRTGTWKHTRETSQTCDTSCVCCSYLSVPASLGRLWPSPSAFRCPNSPPACWIAHSLSEPDAPASPRPDGPSPSYSSAPAHGP